MKYQPTSREAWESLLSGDLDRSICAYLHRHFLATCQDIEDGIGRSHQAVSGNLRHLVEAGLVEASGYFGVTHSGRRAIRWQLRFAPQVPQRPVQVPFDFVKEPAP